MDLRAWKVPLNVYFSLRPIPEMQVSSCTPVIVGNCQVYFIHAYIVVSVSVSMNVWVFFLYYLCIEMQWKPYAPSFWKSPLCRGSPSGSLFYDLYLLFFGGAVAPKKTKKRREHTPASNSIDNGFPRTCRLRYVYIYIYSCTKTKQTETPK